MKLKIKQEFKDRVNKLMKELDINAAFNLKCDYEDFYSIADRIPQCRVQRYKMDVVVDIPDDMVELENESD